MAVDFDMMLEWAENKFGDENVRVKHTAHGTEICVNSPFALRLLGKYDTKHHLWLNPEGGRKGIEGGAYRCWLTDQMGSLVSLVSEFDGIPYDEAEELITGTTSLRALERQVHEFFGHKETVAEMEEVIEDAPTEDLAFPDWTFSIDGMRSGDRWKAKARSYLGQRKIPTAGLYVCTNDPEYGNRIIIPWHDKAGKLVFWNGRTMSDHKKALRYAKPKQGEQDNCLFMTAWPDPGTKIYIMEGEFDAISLSLADLVGCACGGKYLSPAQIELLRGYIPVLAFDADESGKEALLNVGRALLEAGFPEVHYVRPPIVYKDWNKLLQKRNIHTVRAYVDRFQKRFTSVTSELLLSASV
jgi:hypothetical protein